MLSKKRAELSDEWRSTKLSDESIKNLNKNELKTEFIDRWFGTQGKKQVLLNRLSKAIQDMGTTNTKSEFRNKANDTKRTTSNTSGAGISIELVKEFFTNKFKKQEQKPLNTFRNGISDTNVRLDLLTQEISVNNIKWNDLSKETNDFKLNKETSQEITDMYFKEVNNKLNNDKQQHGDEINELYQENEYLREVLKCGR